jgi:hypothetical protein
MTDLNDEKLNDTKSLTLAIKLLSSILEHQTKEYKTKNDTLVKLFENNNDNDSISSEDSYSNKIITKSMMPAKKTTKKMEAKHCCECGSIVNKMNLAIHLKCKKHKDFLSSKNPVNSTTQLLEP